jgi:two-component system, OmpR family, response regulator BaeR
MTPTILIVEDEPALSSLVADYVAAAGWTPSVIADGAAALAAIRAHPPTLLVLDLMLPGLDGLSVCRAVRAFSTLPIIMVTAQVQEIDRLLGLDSGADDYVCKPFSPRELVARIKVQLRRLGPPDEVTPPLLVDEATRRARVRGHALELTPTEFDLLATLARRPGVVFSRAALLDIARGDALDVSDRTVDTHIKNLRRKLAELAPGENLVHSVYGVGYRLEFAYP